jgi:hypothetical protein
MNPKSSTPGDVSWKSLSSNTHSSLAQKAALTEFSPDSTHKCLFLIVPTPYLADRWDIRPTVDIGLNLENKQCRYGKKLRNHPPPKSTIV